MMQLTHIFRTAWALTAIASLSSCFAYKVFPSKDQHYAPVHTPTTRKKAFIINENQTKEIDILRQSGMYILTRDSLDSEAVHLELAPLTFKHRDDGPAIIVSLLTLGQVPVLYRDTYAFSFSEIKVGDNIPKCYNLDIGKVYWFWNLFAFRKRFSRKAGQALAIAYQADHATK